MSVASSVLALLVGIVFVAAGVRDAAASAVSCCEAASTILSWDGVASLRDAGSVVFGGS